MNLDDQEKEQIKFNTEVLKMLVFSFFTTGGGTVTLYIQRGPDAFTVTGTIFAVASGIVGFAIFLHTSTIINK